MKPEDAIHPLAKAVLDSKRVSREDYVQLGPLAFARYERLWGVWEEAGRPILTDEAKAALENAYALRESLAQEIHIGLKIRGLWNPDRASDLITAIFQAIDEAKMKREGADEATLAAVDEAMKECDKCDLRCDCGSKTFISPLDFDGEQFVGYLCKLYQIRRARKGEKP